MTGSRTALGALVILAVLLVLSWRDQSASDQASRDADLVYCMAPDHQLAFVSAAVSLKLIRAGSSPSAIKTFGPPMSLGEWRSRDSADFQRACSAYAAQTHGSSGSPGGSSGPGGGYGALLLILLPTAVGAVLGLEFDEIKRGAERRWAQADSLRDSWSAFRRVMETYARERQKFQSSLVPEERDINALRADLVTGLREAQARHRTSPSIEWLRQRLTDAPLGPEAVQGWPSGDSEEAFSARRERAHEIVKALAEYDDRLQGTASKLEGRIWLSSRL